AVASSRRLAPDLAARMLFESGIGFTKFVDNIANSQAFAVPNQPTALTDLVHRFRPIATNQPLVTDFAHRVTPVVPSGFAPVNVNELPFLATQSALGRKSDYDTSGLVELPRVGPINRQQRPQATNQAFRAAEESLARALMMAYGVPRYPIGTDASAQYIAAGMGSAWLPSSQNQHLSSLRYQPGLLMALANYGMPIAPALAASVSGSVPATLNTAAEASRRTIGILPSLQTLTGLTKSEQEMLRGYMEGVGGLPWADTVDFISKMTSNLLTPQRARGA
ncbi:MAG: hypothetical protein QXZ09_09805, partial [Candidatus Methanomethylicaceae archaeon]